MNLVFVAGIAEKLREWFTGFSGALLSIIVKLMYALCTFIFTIMDVLQLLVRKVAGLDKVYYTSADYHVTGQGETGDIAYNIIQNIISGETPILANVFWSMIILGAILLFLTTLVAILRSEYATLDSKSSSKGQIVGQALKAIASFAVVPIVAVFGMYLANVILQAIDGATTVSTTAPGASNYFASGTLEDGTGRKSYINYIFYTDNVIPTTGTPISGYIFSASCYKANRIRFYTPFQKALINGSLDEDGVFHNYSANINEASALLDTAFSNGYVLKNGEVDLSDNEEKFEKDYLYPFAGNNFLSNKAPTFSSFDKNNISLVWYYYDLWSFDFIVCIGALVVAAKLLIDLVFGLMKRIFELIVLFLIAAPLSALMPLDNGNAISGWRKQFISKAIGAYAPILGLNLFFLIIPEISKIQFFGTNALGTNTFAEGAMAGINKIVSVLFIIVGLVMVKDLVGLIANLIGGDNTMEEGGKISGAVGGAAMNIATAAVAPGAVAAKAVRGGAKMTKNKINKSRTIRAEKGQVLAQMEADDEADGGGRMDSYKKLSARKQGSALKKLRMNMSDEDRQKALDNRRENRGRIAVSKNWVARVDQRWADKDARKTKAKEGAEASRAGNLRRAVESGIDISSRDARFLKKREKRDTKREELDTKREERDTARLKKRQDRPWENFNTRVFGKEGTAERETAEQRISARRGSESLQGFADFGKVGKSIADALKEGLTPLVRHLGGEFGKSVKEGGGTGAILRQATGTSEKSYKEGEATKEQLKLMAAQARAQEIMNSSIKNSKTSSGSSSVKLDSASIDALAKAIADKTKDK